jgi:hypothetical protein
MVLTLSSVPGWYQDGTGMGPGWCRDGTEMVQVWYRDVSRMVPGWYRDGARMVPGWFQDGTGMLHRYTVHWQRSQSKVLIARCAADALSSGFFRLST